MSKKMQEMDDGDGGRMEEDGIEEDKVQNSIRIIDSNGEKRMIVDSVPTGMRERQPQQPKNVEEICQVVCPQICNKIRKKLGFKRFCRGQFPNFSRK